MTQVPKVKSAFVSRCSDGSTTDVAISWQVSKILYALLDV
jgi:hypothetical protein